MRVLYHLPSPNTIYAGRTIFHGYRHAFLDLGHRFQTLTAADNPTRVFDSYRPDLFVTSLNSYHLRYLNPAELIKRQAQGLSVAVNIPFWQSALSHLRLNESGGLADQPKLVQLIRRGFGSFYFNSVAQDDQRMTGFKKGTGKDYLTIPLAADRIALSAGKVKPQFRADLSYIGTYLPEKHRFFKEQVFPLRRRYRLKLYGQDWTIKDRLIGLANRFGQYYNVPWLSSVQKPKLQLEDEAHIYASTIISLNVHEDYQKKFGGDCNERTFKIPLCNGFEITDDVACIRRYFKEDKELVIARDRQDWFAKIEYYLTHRSERQRIVRAGRRRVLQDHTYHNRVQQMLAAAKPNLRSADRKPTSP